MVTFSRYSGDTPFCLTSIDDIPLDEQEAFFAERGWEWGEGVFISDEQDDELYSAWAEAQVEQGVV